MKENKDVASKVLASINGFERVKFFLLDTDELVSGEGGQTYVEEHCNVHWRCLEVDS